MDTHTQLLPRARHDRLVVEEIGVELLIYDTANDRAHTLNRTAALVWKMSDGKRSASEIALAAGKELLQPFSEQMVWFTLAKLDEYQLLDGSLPVLKAMAGMSRREFITKFAVAAAVVPVVKTLKIPAAPSGGDCQGLNGACTPEGPFCCLGLFCCPGILECMVLTNCP